MTLGTSAAPRRGARVIAARRPVRVAVTLGDPGGVGPEVVEKALRALTSRVPPSGDDAPDAPALSALAIGPPEFRDRFSGLADFDAVDASRATPGRAAGLAIERAARLALGGRADAVVTGPVHKPALLEAGYLPGHTETFMALAGAPEVGMLMCDEGLDVAGRRVGPPKRVLLATVHVPLARVPELVTEELLVSQTRLLERALRDDWGVEAPRIALCALNPHASDDGLFGTEERDVYAPALRALARGSASASGPFPADTVFARAFGGEFDAVVAPYHDVGMAAFKTAAFGVGVNATVGLPFVRTSPDHGTAFDIAGRDVADPGSTIRAILLAARLAARRSAASGTSP